MTARLEEQIRRYTEAIDFMAAPVEELITGDMASKLDIEAGQRVDIRVSVGAVEHRRRLPAWAHGVGAAVFVLLLAIPVWLLVSNLAADVADTPTTISWPPVESGDPFLRAQSDGVATGVGWLPSRPITFAVNGSVGEGRVNSDSAGSFNFPLASIGLGFEPGDILSASDGVSTRQMVIPFVTVDTFDLGLGVASGTAMLPDGSPIELRIIGSAPAVALSRLQTTVESGAWSFAFVPISSEQAITESWISIDSGNGLFEIRLAPTGRP